MGRNRSRGDSRQVLRGLARRRRPSTERNTERKSMATAGALSSSFPAGASRQGREGCQQHGCLHLGRHAADCNVAFPAKPIEAPAEEGFSLDFAGEERASLPTHIRTSSDASLAACWCAVVLGSAYRRCEGSEAGPKRRFQT